MYSFLEKIGWTGCMISGCGFDSEGWAFLGVAVSFFLFLGLAASAKKAQSVK